METNLQRAAEVYGEAVTSNNEVDFDGDSPLIDLFVLDSGPKMYKAMTPFTRKEFGRIWDKIGVSFCTEWNRGRGPKSKTTPKDAFFMLLSVLHLPTKWDNHGMIFLSSQ